MFDLKVFIESDIDACIERLKIRNLVIPGYTPEEIRIRCEEVDRVNAVTVQKSKERADMVVDSIVTKPIRMHKRVPSTEALNLMISKENEVEVNPPVILQDEKDRPTVDAPPAQSFGVKWERDMAKHILGRLDDASIDRPFLVGVIGMPGSGKSVSSLLLATELDDIGVKSMIFPHDGYHYTLDHLKTFSNADDFLYRRGAPDTFDSQSLLRDLDRIRNGTEVVVMVPGFDHSKGDPEPDKHVFYRSTHRVVVCEGLYLLHDDNGWEEVGKYLDLAIYLDTDIETCMDRVKVRNQCIPGYTVEEIIERVDKVDRANAMTVLKSKKRAQIVMDCNQ